MMLRRAMRVNEPGFPAFAGGVKRSTSAVPSQLFPTKTTGVVVVVPGFGGLAAGAVVAAITVTAHASVAASANAPSLVLICRVLPRRPSTALPPGPDAITVTGDCAGCAGCYQSRGFPSGMASNTSLASTRSTGYGVVAR